MCSFTHFCTRVSLFFFFAAIQSCFLFPQNNSLSLGKVSKTNDQQNTSALLSSDAYRPRVTNGHFILKKFERVFGMGPTSGEYKFLVNSITALGGICETYDNRNLCRNLRDGIPISASSVVRQGLLGNACGKAIKNPTRVQYALEIMGQKVDSPLTEEKIQDIHSLFYPADPIDSEVIAILSQLTSLDMTEMEQTQAVLYTFCVSPEWTVL